MLAHPGVILNFPYRVDALERPGGSGLVVLSRFPIVRTEFHRFDAQGNCFKFWRPTAFRERVCSPLRSGLASNFSGWPALTSSLAIWAMRRLEQPATCRIQTAMCAGANSLKRGASWKICPVKHLSCWERLQFHASFPLLPGHDEPNDPAGSTRPG